MSEFMQDIEKLAKALAYIQSLEGRIAKLERTAITSYMIPHDDGRAAKIDMRLAVVEDFLKKRFSVPSAFDGNKNGDENIRFKNDSSADVITTTRQTKCARCGMWTTVEKIIEERKDK
jgi:hypothetical protein